MHKLTRIIAFTLALLLIISAGCTEVTGTTTEPTGSEVEDVNTPGSPGNDPPSGDVQPGGVEGEPSEDPQSDVQQPSDETEDPTEPTPSPSPSPSEPTQPDDEQGQDQEEPGQGPAQPVDEEEPGEDALSGTVIVHYIDVGQGDSILIQAPGKTVLIDGGTRSAGSTVVNYLNKQGVKTLDLIIATHPHEDHIGGLISVLKNFTVKEVIDSGIDHTTKTFEEYLDLILEDESIAFTEAKPGLSRNLGGNAELHVLYPKSPSASDLNNASVVTRLSFGDTSFLFTGDAEQHAEQQILNSGSTLASTVLKIGHHGSETSTTQTFLNKVKPKYAVISCGTGNSYEHPRQSTLDKLKAGNINTYRTDTHGNVVIKSDGSKITVSTAKSADSKTVFTGADKQDPEPEPDPEPDPEPAPSDPDPGKGMFVGSTKSDKYHWPDCRHAKNILPENEVWFKDAKAALAAGYVPCGVCKPPRD